MKSDEAGLWLARRNCNRHLAPKGSHARHLIDVHTKIFRDGLHRLKVAAEAEGIKPSMEELADQSCEAKNSTLEYGGYSPHTMRTGSNPDWSRAVVAEEKDYRTHPFARAFRVRSPDAVRVRMCTTPPRALPPNRAGTAPR